MEFICELPWPWSLTPVEALQQLAHFYVPAFLARLAIAALMGLIGGLVLRRGNSLFGIPAVAMAVVGWVLGGQPLPLLALVVVIYVTVATYRGESGTRRSLPKLLTVLALRILALLLTFITIARPTVLVRTEDKTPS